MSVARCETHLSTTASRTSHAHPARMISTNLCGRIVSPCLLGEAAAGGSSGPWPRGVGEMPWGLRAVVVEDKNPERSGNSSRRLILMSLKEVKSGTPRACEALVGTAAVAGCDCGPHFRIKVPMPSRHFVRLGCGLRRRIAELDRLGSNRRIGYCWKDLDGGTSL